MQFGKGPAWLDHAVFYEIYPQSFLDTNADGIGDLEGIIQKLDYIRSLGCNAIWMNPCFESPFGDAGYDVSDYYSIAPRYGTNRDMQRLFEAAHSRGIRVFLDLVPGHTSIEHKWFRESCRAERNAYTDRYVWTNDNRETPGNMGYLRGISERNGTCAFNYYSFQPALNYGYYQPDPEKPWQQSMDAPGPQATVHEMESIMRFWLDMGCDGFRVDMAMSLVKGDPDEEGTIRLWQHFREFYDREYPDCALISEWGNPEHSLRGGFHMDFLLHFGPSHYLDLFRGPAPYFSRQGNHSLRAFMEKYLEYARQAGDTGMICIPSGNHDMDRMARHLSQDEMKLAFLFLMTMPGVPFLYYGDEIGLRYLENLKSKEGGYQRTGARTPMQWDHTTNAGFSQAAPHKLYLPVDTSSDRPTVEEQEADPDSLLHTVRTLIHLRLQEAALGNRAGFELVSDALPLVYQRGTDAGKALVILNPSMEPVCWNARGTLLYQQGDVEPDGHDGWRLESGAGCILRVL